MSSRVHCSVEIYILEDRRLKGLFLGGKWLLWKGEIRNVLREEGRV